MGRQAGLAIETHEMQTRFSLPKTSYMDGTQLDVTCAASDETVSHREPNGPWKCSLSALRGAGPKRIPSVGEGGSRHSQLKSCEEEMEKKRAAHVWRVGFCQPCQSLFGKN